MVARRFGSTLDLDQSPITDERLLRRKGKSAVGTSRHVAALRNLVAIGA
jgi:hypothetical protein